MYIYCTCHVRIKKLTAVATVTRVEGAQLRVNYTTGQCTCIKALPCFVESSSNPREPLVITGKVLHPRVFGCCESFFQSAREELAQLRRIVHCLLYTSESQIVWICMEQGIAVRWPQVLLQVATSTGTGAAGSKRQNKKPFQRLCTHY